MQEVSKFKKIERWAPIPVKNSNANSLYIFKNAYTTSIQKNSTVNVSSGVVFTNAPSHVAFVLGRHPHPNNKNLQINRAFIGLGDEMKTKITNIGDDSVEIPPFTHLTDFVFLRVSKGSPNIVDSLDDTERGDSGFGSTGLK